MLKKWQQTKAQEDHATHREVNRKAKTTVAVERARSSQELYAKLDTREGEKAMSRDQAVKENYQSYFVNA